MLLLVSVDGVFDPEEVLGELGRLSLRNDFGKCSGIRLDEILVRSESRVSLKLARQFLPMPWDLAYLSVKAGSVPARPA